MAAKRAAHIIWDTPLTEIRPLAFLNKGRAYKNLARDTYTKKYLNTNSFAPVLHTIAFVMVPCYAYKHNFGAKKKKYCRVAEFH
mmetsp:Transcript_2815/g.3284  ORF Transcript_2815/g.3284 Transcript_2815/m.3284 type:complete len:84 (-) Transcript_2815:111-362(-)